MEKSYFLTVLLLIAGEKADAVLVDKGYDASVKNVLKRLPLRYTLQEESKSYYNPMEKHMFAFLLPKSAPFFAMLLEQNGLLRSTAELLVEMLEDSVGKGHVHKEITFLEDEADKLYGRIVLDLSQIFITPIDREDILRISHAQEESIDCLHGLSTRLHIFEFSSVRFPALQMGRTIAAMLDLTRLMLEGLSKRRDCHKTREFRKLRGECDMLLPVALAELMDEQQEITPVRIMQILKWSQAYDRINMLLEQVNALAETIEEAVLKNV